jgi:hypothetical protein
LISRSYNFWELSRSSSLGKDSEEKRFPLFGRKGEATSRWLEGTTTISCWSNYACTISYSSYSDLSNDVNANSKSCLLEIEKLQRGFIWGNNSEGRKVHLIGWDTLTLPTQMAQL